MQEIAEAVLDAEIKVGELTAKIPKATTNHKNLEIRNSAEFLKSKADQLKEIGIKQDTAERCERLAKHPEIVEKAKQEARKRGEVVTRFVNIPLSRFVVRWSWESGRRGW